MPDLNTEAREVLRRQIVALKAEVRIHEMSFWSNLEVIYENPGAALKNMRREFANEKNFGKMLDNEPERFGIVRGGLLTKSFWEAGASANAKQALKELPEKTRTLVTAEKKLQVMERDFHGDRPRFVSMTGSREIER
jgi:hypothetical protein